MIIGEIGDSARNFSTPQDIANARLIAAAPELLAALEAIVANPDMADGEEPRRLIANARAAIASATQPR